LPRTQPVFGQLPLADQLRGEVDAWAGQGWRSGVTQTTFDLLHYWFDRPEESSERFYDCQKRAIETVIYCHEVLQARSLKDLYERVAPDALRLSKTFLDEIDASPFMKTCLKMATGTGKTWVLAALLVWQYFNASRNEKPSGASGVSGDWYSQRFLIVTPGHEVMNRILDAFKGPRDPDTGLRNRQKADVTRSLFVPPELQKEFNFEILEPGDVRPNSPSPDGPYVLITNWQQFKLKSDKDSLWEQVTGAEIGEQPRGEFLLDYLTEHPDLVVMNDEAHHVHSVSLTGKGDEELVWRRFITLLNRRMQERYGPKRRLFLQEDFSATPFFGSGTQKRFFPHIIYDYDLKQASREMLVKQLFLVEKQAVGGEIMELRSLAGQEWRAARKEPEAGKRQGELIGLSAGQKTLLFIGKTKLEQIAGEFRQKGIDRKPVMMVLCEETAVADKVAEHLATISGADNNTYDESRVMVIHTELADKELENARLRLNKIDDNSDPLTVVVSVLMLREGFDRKNICVIVVLRAAEADLLLEQIVGRGLRMMFPRDDNEAIWQEKIEALNAIKNNRQPSSQFDFLFIVEHPRFRSFYERLKGEGYLIGEGGTGPVTGSLIPVDAVPSRIPQYDLAWPVQIFEQGKFPEITEIGIETLPPYPLIEDFESFRDSRKNLFITETQVDTGKHVRTWKLPNRYFNYDYFLANASKAIAQEGKAALLTGHLAEIAQVLDEYVSKGLFGKEVDFSLAENYPVLNDTNVFDHIVTAVRTRLIKSMEEMQYERTGEWRQLSSVSRLLIREKAAVDSWKCIYPKQSVAAKAGGFERKFINNTLENSVDVLAYAKLDKKHGLKIQYRDEFGILRPYEIDFLVKTKESMYLVETKSQWDLEKENVAVKALAAKTWCKSATGITPPTTINQPPEWEYLLITDKVFEQNLGQSFEAMVTTMRSIRDRTISARASQTRLPISREERIEEYIKRGEGARLEFKSALCWDYKLSRQSKEIENATTKTLCAFMNSEGGTLVIGVDDKFQVIGLEKDFSLLSKPNRDGFEQKLTGLVNGSLGKENATYVHLSWQDAGGKTVAVVTVEKSKRPVYLDLQGKSEFYIRAGNTSQPLDVREATIYIRDHWPSL
jgi:type III restriction enzyme